MEIITSHTNADFDALASMVAAKKLYPDARIVFAGSQEKSMRDFFLDSAAYAVETERLRNIELFVPRERLPAAAEEEFFHADLVGLRAAGSRSPVRAHHTGVRSVR